MGKKSSNTTSMQEKSSSMTVAKPAIFSDNNVGNFLTLTPRDFPPVQEQESMLSNQKIARYKVLSSLVKEYPLISAFSRLNCVQHKGDIDQKFIKQRKDLSHEERQALKLALKSSSSNKLFSKPEEKCYEFNFHDVLDDPYTRLIIIRELVDQNIITTENVTEDFRLEIFITNSPAAISAIAKINFKNYDVSAISTRHVSFFLMIKKPFSNDHELSSLLNQVYRIQELFQLYLDHKMRIPAVAEVCFTFTIFAREYYNKPTKVFSSLMFCMVTFFAPVFQHTEKLIESFGITEQILNNEAHIISQKLKSELNNNHQDLIIDPPNYDDMETKMALILISSALEESEFKENLIGLVDFLDEMNRKMLMS